MLVSCVEAADVSLAKVVFWRDEDSYVPGQTLVLFLDVVNNDGVAMRNVPVDISVDGRGVYSGVVDLNGSSAETIRISSENFDSDWDPYSCGTKSFRIKLKDSYSEKGFTVSGKRFREITVSPEKITPANFTEIKVLDVRGGGHPAAKILLDKDGEDYKTQSNGVGLVRIIIADEFEDPFGRFGLDIWALGYCKQTKYFNVDEQHSLSARVEPESPKPYEPFSVYVMNEKGDAVSGAIVSITGNISAPYGFVSDASGVVYVNINNSGQFRVSVRKADYMNYSKSFIVSTIPVLDIKFPEPEALVGVDYQIVVSGEGRVLDDVDVTIKSFNESVSFSNGSIVFTPNYPLEYNVEVRKTGYVSSKASFRAINKFSLEVVQLSWEMREILIKALDHGGEPVAYATISLEGGTEHGLTDIDGFVSLSIPVRDSLTFTAEKDGFAEETFSIKPNKTLYMDVSPAEVKLGDKMALIVHNDFGDNVIAEITITYPDGSNEKVMKDKHVFYPDTAGEYFVSAQADGYTQASRPVDVKPRELSLSVNVSRGVIFVHAESGRRPVGGLYVWFDTPAGRDYVITNSQGSAVFNTVQEGVYVAYVNDTPYMYTRKSIYVKKEGFPLGSVLGVIVTLVVAGLIAYVIIKTRRQVPEKKGKKSKTWKSSLAEV